MNGCPVPLSEPYKASGSGLSARQGAKNLPGETPNPLIDNQIKSELGSHGRLTDHTTGNNNVVPNSGVVVKDENGMYLFSPAQKAHAPPAGSPLLKYVSSMKPKNIPKDVNAVSKNNIAPQNVESKTIWSKPNSNIPKTADTTTKEANLCNLLSNDDEVRLICQGIS